MKSYQLCVIAEFIGTICSTPQIFLDPKECFSMAWLYFIESSTSWQLGKEKKQHCIYYIKKDIQLTRKVYCCRGMECYVLRATSILSHSGTVVRWWATISWATSFLSAQATPFPWGETNSSTRAVQPAPRMCRQIALGLKDERSQHS